MTRLTPGPDRARSVGARTVGVVATLLLVVGPPLLLATLLGDPLPHQLPTAGTVEAWLRSPVSDRAALDAVALLAWVLWLHLCGCLLVELARQARGAAWQMPCGGWNQRLAQHLIAAVLITVPSLTVATAASAGPVSPAAAPVAAPVAAAASAPMSASVAEVVAPQLAAARLVAWDLPAAAGLGEAAHPTANGHHPRPLYREYVVAPPHGRYHDNLWDIAERHLGDPLRWREIFRLNDGRLMTDGQRLTQASLIRPGWVLRMPADAAGLSDDHGRPEPVARPQQPSPPHARRHLEPVAPPDRSELPAPAPATTPPSGTTTRPPAAADARPHPTVAPGHRSGLNPAVPVGAGLSVAALGLLAALERRRRVAHRRRRPGTRFALLDPSLAAAETRLRRDARDACVVAGTIRLAVALAADRDPQLTVRTAWHRPDGAVDLQLTAARVPPEPFTATELGWRLAAADHGYLFAVGDRTDPAPALIPVGSSGDAVCYVNLELIGLAGIDGPTGDVDAVIAGIVRALAGAPWAQELTRVLVPPRLRRAVAGLERVEVLDDPESQLAHLAAYADQVAATPAGESSLAEARRAGDADTVGVALVAGFTAAELPAPVRTAAISPAAPVLALLAGTDPQAQTWTLCDGTLSIPGLADDLQPLRADPGEIDTAERLLDHVLDPTPIPADDPAYAELAADCPPAPEPASFEVRVLGPVDVAGVGRVRRTPVLGILVFLALHRRPVSSQQLSAALWPDRERNGHVLRTRMSEARNLVDGGIERDGRSWTLAAAVGCDWQRFTALAAGDRDGQLAALALVRGRPFDSYDAEWVHVEGHAHAIEASIVDLALAVAEGALAEADPATATVAAEAGLRASPYDERLYRVAMTAAAARDATGEVNALRRRLARVLDDEIEPDDQIEAATLRTYDQAVTRSRRATG